MGFMRCRAFGAKLKGVLEKLKWLVTLTTGKCWGMALFSPSWENPFFSSVHRKKSHESRLCSLTCPVFIRPPLEAEISCRYSGSETVFNVLLTQESEVWMAQSPQTLCNPMDCSPPGSSVHGISQARILEWVAISFSRGSSLPRDWTWVSCVAGRFFFFTIWTTRVQGPSEIPSYSFSSYPGFSIDLDPCRTFA